MKFWHRSLFKIKMVENMARLDKEERKQAIKTAGYNTFLLKSEECFIDLFKLIPEPMQ